MGASGKRKGSANTFGSGGISPAIPPNLQPNITITPVNQNNPQVQSQAPNDQNTPVTPQALTNISQMTDDELAALVIASRNVQMPNYLADRDDPTQKFVFQAGLNEKPMVLDQQAFNQFMQDNNISQGEIINRSVNSVSYTNQQGYTTSLTSQQVQDILKYSKLTYIGGKHGGQAYGAGAYFAMNGGSNTGYGQNTATAVLHPTNAKIISEASLQSQAYQFAQSHPKFAKAVGSYNTGTNGNASIYALAMGYNVITDHSMKNGTYKRPNSGDYYNVIDRSALVYLQ